MAVHALSVIPTWVNTFYPDFYVSLTDKEEYAYTSNSGLDLNRWRTLFTNLAGRMDTWKAATTDRDLKDFVSALYSWHLLNILYATPYDETKATGYYVFDMGGFITSTLIRPVNYYDDLAETGVGTGIWKSIKLGADTSGVLTGAGDIYAINNYAATELARITYVQDQSRTESSAIVNKLLFEEIPPAGSKTKEQMGRYIYGDLHYKKIADTLPVGLTVPVYTPPIT